MISKPSRAAARIKRHYRIRNKDWLCLDQTNTFMHR